MILKKWSLAFLFLISLKAYSQTDSTADKQNPVLRPEFASKLKEYAAPLILVSYGIIAQEYKAFKRVDLNVRADLQEDYPSFQNHLDDKLQYMPVISVYALGLAGVRGKNSLMDKTAMFFISNTIMSMSVDFIKTQTHKLRPDGSDFRAFPSGHTATAFAAAEFMAQEYKDASPWLAVAGYSAAAATGGLRMLNNKHWFSDVVTGAGVGIMSTKIAYFIYPLAKDFLFRKRESKWTVLPGYQNGFWACSARVSLN